jgi:hypothetical protein
MSLKNSQEAQTKYMECLEFLENLLKENCGDPKIGLVSFSNNIENGWALYRKKYLQAISEFRKTNIQE